MKQCGAGVLRQRQSNFVAPLAQDSQRAAFPLNVGKAKLNDIASTQPKPNQQQNDGTIAKASGRATLTSSDDPVHFVGGEQLPQCSQAPMRESWNGLVEAESEQAPQTEIPKNAS